MILGNKTFPQRGSTLTGKNFLLGEKILSFKSWPQLIWEVKLKIIKLLPINEYPFTLI